MRGEGEEVDLVLRDEHPGDPGIERRERPRVERDILDATPSSPVASNSGNGCSGVMHHVLDVTAREQGSRRVQDPEANTLGLVEKAVPARKPGGAGRARVD